jgi:hypothetical protein
VKKLIVGAAMAWMLAALSGCETIVTADAEGIVTPLVAVGVFSFDTDRVREPHAARVNAEVARLLRQHEDSQRPELVAAR